MKLQRIFLFLLTFFFSLACLSMTKISHLFMEGSDGHFGINFKQFLKLKHKNPVRGVQLCVELKDVKLQKIPTPCSIFLLSPYLYIFHIRKNYGRMKIILEKHKWMLAEKSFEEEDENAFFPLMRVHLKSTKKKLSCHISLLHHHLLYFPV